MRLTIIPSDKLVIIDGKAIMVRDAEYPAGVHAVQWYGDKGEVEFDDVPGEPKKLNEMIDTIAPYQALIDAYRAIEAADNPVG